MFEEILETIEIEKNRKLAEELIETIPKYYYSVPASSTGKYHPNYALGEGGLYRHTIALCKFLNYMLTIMTNYTQQERDEMRIAGMMHDTRKSGNQEDYEKNKYTKFDHPLLAAEVVRSFKGKEWDDNSIERIASYIETHMGQWNTDKRSNVVLPTPTNKYQMLVHLADYLASRKDIEVKFNKSTIDQSNSITENSSPEECAELIMNFGKYKGQKLKDIPYSYFTFLLKDDFDREPYKTAMQILLRKEEEDDDLPF